MATCFGAADEGDNINPWIFDKRGPRDGPSSIDQPNDAIGDTCLFSSSSMSGNLLKVSIQMV